MANSALLKLAIIPLVAIMFSTAASAADKAMPAADNDDSYKLPLFVPKVAQPNVSQKVIFDDAKGENDEIYSLPKRGAVKPNTLSPAAGATDAQKNYNQQYEEYQRQMKVYNEQMADYKKQLATQQQTQTQSTGETPGDNDSSYVLPGQYMESKKVIKPKPAVARAVPTPAKPQVATPVAPAQQQYQAPVDAQPQPAQQQYRAPAAAQYNQKYNYSDQDDRQTPSQSNNTIPDYYYQ